MNNKIMMVIVGVVLVGGSFYAGMKYTQGSTGAAFVQGAGAGFANLTPEERQARFAQFGGAGGGANARGARTAGGGLASGEILSKDDKSVTVKLRDGGSKIIFLSNTTTVSKTVESSVSDLSVGEQVTISGKANADGSISAESVQVRPATKPPAPVQ